MYVHRSAGALVASSWSCGAGVKGDCELLGEGPGKSKLGLWKAACILNCWTVHTALHRPTNLLGTSQSHHVYKQDEPSYNCIKAVLILCLRFLNDLFFIWLSSTCISSLGPIMLSSLKLILFFVTQIVMVLLLILKSYFYNLYYASTVVSLQSIFSRLMVHNFIQSMHITEKWDFQNLS